MNEENLSNNGKSLVERDEKGRLKPGSILNPTGPKAGYKQFDTLFEEAILKIVKEQKIPIGNPEVDMVVKAVIEALKGNYGYFRDIMDRRYGKAPQPLVGGDENWQPIQIVINKKDDTIPPETTEGV